MRSMPEFGILKVMWLWALVLYQVAISNICLTNSDVKPESFILFLIKIYLIQKSSVAWDIIPCHLLSQLMFWRKISLPSSASKNKLSKKPVRKKLASSSAYSSTLKMEVTCSAKMSVDFQGTMRHFIPEDRTLPPLLWEPQILLTWFNLVFQRP
jgi:hypothetical protein